MYTVLWTDQHGEDHWDRFETSDDVTWYLKKNDLLYDEDVLIFYPDAEYHCSNGILWMKKNYEE